MTATTPASAAARRRAAPLSASSATASRVEDPYHWLKDQSYPTVDDEDVLAYLRAENAYFEAAMAPHRPLIETLFQEMRGRIPEDDSSVPVRDGDWLYWWAFQPGAQYRTWYRRPGRAGGEPQTILDEAAEAAGKQYFRLGAMEVSPDGRYAAILVDDDGSERFQLAHPRDRHRPRRRDGDRGRHRPAGLDRRQPRHRLHRGQRELAQLPRPAAPARPAGRRATARSTRRPRISPSPSASAAPRTGASS